MSASLDWPTPYTVGWHVYSDGVLDANNQPLATYTPPRNAAGTQVPVFGWETPKSLEEGLGGHASRVEETVKLFAPPTFRPGIQDLIDLPDLGQWEVVGIPESADGNPFGWNPGSTINLRQVRG